MQTGQTLKGTLLAGLLLVAPTAWADPTFNVSLNTSSISGTTGQVVFELIDGDGVVNNSLSLANFDFGGGSIAGAPDYVGTSGVSGDLSSSISMDDSGGFAAFTQPLTFGASFSFQLTTTNNFSGSPAPDAFSMALCAPDFSACFSDDQASGLLLQLDLTGGTLSPASFTVNGASAQGLPAPVVTFATTAPEPSTGLLFALALTGALWSVRGSARRDRAAQA